MVQSLRTAGSHLVDQEIPVIMKPTISTSGPLKSLLILLNSICINPFQYYPPPSVSQTVYSRDTSYTSYTVIPSWKLAFPRQLGFLHTANITLSNLYESQHFSLCNFLHSPPHSSQLNSDVS